MTEPARPNASSPRGNRVLGFGHRGGPLLLGVCLGALLVGSIAVVAVPPAVPAEPPVALQAATVPDDAALPIPVAAFGIPQAAAAAVDVATQADTQAATQADTQAATQAGAQAATQAGAQAEMQAAHATAHHPAPAAAPAAPVRRPEVRQAGRAAAVISATNVARRAAGCKALVSDARLTAAAQQHAEDMASEGYFSHTADDGRTFDARIRDSGYRSPGGENIARGQRSAAEVVDDWMDSAGHRRNILDCTFRTIGVGISGTYWVQDFGR